MDAYAQSVEDGIGNRSRNRPQGRFSGPQRLHLRSGYQNSLNFRHFAEAKNRIVGPARTDDALPVKTDALLQRPTGGLDSAPLELVKHTIRIDDFADIGGERQLPDPDFFRDFDLCHRGAIGAQILVASKAEA